MVTWNIHWFHSRLACTAFVWIFHMNDVFIKQMYIKEKISGNFNLKIDFQPFILYI